MRFFASVAVYLSFFWNLILVVGVVIGAEYALPRAAGGQFESFPNFIRLIYLITTAVVVYQLYLWDRFIREHKSNKYRIVKFFTYLGVVSVVVNLSSRSPYERWNAIPAAIIAISFYKQSKDVRID